MVSGPFQGSEGVAEAKVEREFQAGAAPSLQPRRRTLLHSPTSPAAANTKSPVVVVGDLEDGDSLENPINVEGNKEKSVTYEELRERLRRKIELLRGNGGEKRSDEKVKSEGKKRKKGSEDDGGTSGKGVSLDEDEDGEEIIEYGKVRLGDEDEGKRGKNKKRKLSKTKELERAKKKEEVKRDNPSTVVKELWKAATSRAMGIKVHDDARLIKESMKSEKRKKEKNSEKWKERIENQEKMKGERQKKRKEKLLAIVAKFTEFKLPASHARDPHKPKSDKFCRFHNEYGHDTNSYYHIRDEIECLIQAGHMKEFIYRDRTTPRRQKRKEPEKGADKPEGSGVNAPPRRALYG